MNNVIELKNVSKKYTYDQKVLDNLNFNLTEGTILGLIGKNGAGKSTIIKGILGLINFDKGDSKVYGEKSFDMTNIVRHKIGYVPQTFSGLKWMKVKFLLEYVGSFYNKWDTNKIEKLVKDWDLDPMAKISSLSEGELQKLSIIKALGHNPALLILDEPVASLDPVARRKFISQLIDMNLNEGKSILFSTHITSDLERVAAEIVLLSNGEIKYQGELSDLKDKVKRLRISSENQLPASLPISSVINYEVDHNGALVTVDNFNSDEINKLETDLAAKISIEDLNLEEIFLELNK